MFVKEKQKSTIKTKVFLFLILISLVSCEAAKDQISLSPTQPVSQTTIVTDTPETNEEFIDPSIQFQSGSLESGQYVRDDKCKRSFNYQKLRIGNLTISIPDQLLRSVDFQTLSEQVIHVYKKLYENTIIPLDNPVNVYVINTPEFGECYSVDDHIFISPDDINSNVFREQLLGAAAKVDLYWVRVGLNALITGEQVNLDQLKDWYHVTDDLDMAGLFVARFFDRWSSVEEIEIARMSALSLVKFAIEEEKIPSNSIGELVDNQVRTRWLSSIGVDRKVNYPYDSSYKNFQFIQKSNCDLFAKSDYMSFCLNRIPTQEWFDEVSEAEAFINNAYYGRNDLVEYLLSEAPAISHLMDKNEILYLEVKDLGNILGYAYGDSITLNKSAVYYYVLHELVHTFEWNTSFNEDDQWMTEGFAEYLGLYLPIINSNVKRSIFEDLNGRVNEEGDADYLGTSYWYSLDPEQLDVTKKYYLANGGKLSEQSEIDPRLFIDAVSFSTMFREQHGGTRGASIGEKYDTLFDDLNYTSKPGMELSYTKAAAFLAWLIDNYSLNRVLDVYVNQAEGGMLDGLSYHELKTDWENWLTMNAVGLTPPK